MAIDGAEVTDRGPACLGFQLVLLDFRGRALAAGGGLGEIRRRRNGRTARRDEAAREGGKGPDGVIQELPDRRVAVLLLASGLGGGQRGEKAARRTGCRRRGGRS